MSIYIILTYQKSHFIFCLFIFCKEGLTAQNHNTNLSQLNFIRLVALSYIDFVVMLNKNKSRYNNTRTPNFRNQVFYHMNFWQNVFLGEKKNLHRFVHHSMALNFFFQ